MKPVALRIAVTVEITGAAGLMRIVRTGAGVGVMSEEKAERRAAIVMFPATVPVCMPTSVVAVVAPAGIVICAVRPPVEN